MKKQKSATQTLADFAAEVTFDDLPTEVVYHTKRLICDTIGCALGAYPTERGRMIRNLVRRWGGNPESTIIGSGEKTSCVNAVLANTEMAYSLDYGDMSIGQGHIAVPVVHAAIPVAEAENSTGRELILSVLLGFDIAFRVAAAAESFLAEEKGEIRRRVVWGGGQKTLGAAIVAGKILGLDGEKMAQALNIGGILTPSPSSATWGRAVEDLPLTKVYPAGWTSLGGVMAALQAQSGYTGPCDILDGENGFLRMQGCQECDYDFMLDQLGEKWWLPLTSYKPWPCCRFIHYSLTAFTEVIEENNIKAEEIEKVILRTAALSPPYFHVKSPSNPINMQFSASHNIACAAFRIKPGPEWQYPERANDPKMVELQKKVTIEYDPSSFEVVAKQLVAGPRPRFAKGNPAVVEVAARGKVFSKRVEYAKGDPWSPATAMSDEELKEKFRVNAAEVLKLSAGWRAKIEKAIETIYRLEEVEHLAELTELLSP